ncbi:RNA polymerase II associated protein 2 [Linnemannia schmuckeri]|uniref:RNA polymerase II subunit B1 CTD phosphatase RPAP2 homolog n=1 Tax=Linnemannia schmuckeri TaxID=64567 RepID=A0A9P5VCD8_9FUNG|nr:RNA polymerase II associated protein 2 [Linnemannia schmuckeri]
MKDDIVVDRSPLVDQYLPPRQPTTTTAPTSSGQRPAPAAMESQGENKLNRKQQLIQQNIELRKKFETMVLQWQEVLLDPVTEEILGEAANRIKQSHYREIIEERNIARLCGYPLCAKPPRDIKGKFRISLQERKVFDISVLKQYCSSTCLTASRWLEGQLTEDPLYLRDNDPERLKIIQVSIIPLDMELAEYHALRAANREQEQETKPAPAFNLPTHRLASVTGQTPGGPVSPTSTTAVTGSTPSSNSLGNAYVQSILASVPTTPSFIKIVERDITSEISREPLDMSDMDQQMQESFGVGAGDEVEGYSVPAPKQKRPSGGSSTRPQRDTKVIEQQMASVTISEDQPMSRTGSSMSMDTQP